MNLPKMILINIDQNVTSEIIQTEIYEIGNYETMLTVKPSPLTHGTIFIYD